MVKDIGLPADDSADEIDNTPTTFENLGIALPDDFEIPVNTIDTVEIATPTASPKSGTKKTSAKKGEEVSAELLLIKNIIDHGPTHHKLMSPKILMENLDYAESIGGAQFSDPALTYLYDTIKNMALSNHGCPDFKRLQHRIDTDVKVDRMRDSVDDYLKQIESYQPKGFNEVLIGPQYKETVRQVKSHLHKEALSLAMQISNEISHGKKKIKSEGLNGRMIERELSGPEEASQWLAEESQRIRSLYGDRRETINVIDGNDLKDAEKLIKDLNEIKDSGLSIHSRTIPWCLPSLTTKLGGIGLNEFIAVCAYTSQLKTSLCIAQAHRASMAGYNVLYLCYEQVAREVWTKFLAFESTNPRFKREFPAQYGTLTAHNFSTERTPETRAYDLYVNAVIKNFSDMSQGDNPIGRLKLAATPTMSMADIWRYAEGLNSKWKSETGKGVQFIVIDYLGIVPDSKRASSDYNANLNIKVLEARQMSTAFDGGRGVSIATPWQVSRGAYEKIRKELGRMDATSPSNANELERSVTSAIGIFYDELCRKAGVAKISWLKSRNSAMFDPYYVKVDPARNRFTDISEEEQSQLAEEGALSSMAERASQIDVSVGVKGI